MDVSEDVNHFAVVAGREDPAAADPWAGWAGAEEVDPELELEIQLAERRLTATAKAKERIAHKALMEGALKRQSNYPGWRSSFDQMTDPDGLAEPIIVDKHTGHVVMRAGHVARLLADSKGGKTMCGLEWCRSSLTGELWLGHFQTRPVSPDASVAFLDPELDTDFSWYAQQVFGDLDRPVVDRLRRIDLVVLKAQGWTWQSELDRNWLADQIGGSERLFSDSVLSLLPGGGGNGRAEASHSMEAVGEFLDQFKALQKRAEVREMLISIHRNSAGAEKSFGSVGWDAKFQALWSIRVEDDVRTLRGLRGRAGTWFPENRVVQLGSGSGSGGGQGRIKYVVPTVQSAAADRAAEAEAKRNAREEALERGLDLMGGVLVRLWDGEDEAGWVAPGVQAVVDALNEELRRAGQRALKQEMFSEFWKLAQRRGVVEVADPDPSAHNKRVVRPGANPTNRALPR